MGREYAVSVTPFTDVSSIVSALAMTAQARQALAAHGPAPLDAFPDIRPLIDQCQVPGSVLDGPSLTQIRLVLAAAPRLIAYGRATRAVAPGIADLADELPTAPDLLEWLHRALDDSGSVTDEASPQLRRLRRGIAEGRRRIVAELERLLQTSDAVAERFVTVRQGRYVIPVRAEARARMRGIVHDRSQSGQTVFVEPEAVIEANNDLVQQLRAEEHETLRILTELTEAVRGRTGDLARLVIAVGELDWVFCRAQAAERMQATAPAVTEDRVIDLRQARHPLLLAQSWSDPARAVVPLDLTLEAERPLVVVTGPNAGGKTIALKTLALCVLLAQVGCHVPAAEGARLPAFDAVYALVGDDQSVADNLSTFSAFVKQMREVLEAATERSLVLLDELGAGTDPDEGAALAQAILETLEARGALVMATTHLEPLKAFASLSPRARNASVEFDAERLAPTFRLVYDRPGQSYALAIAARLGLPAELIARAHAHRSDQAAHLSELLARMEVHALSEAERLLDLERREQEAGSRLAAAREAEANATARARTIVSKAKAEAAALVNDVRRTLAAEWEQLKSGERDRRSLEASRQRVTAVAARVAESPPAGATLATPVALAPGALVTAEPLGLRGELESIVGATATVRSGTITVRVPLGALRPAGDPPAPPSRGGTRVPEKTDVVAELRLLGRTTDEARDLVERYLDDAFVAGLTTVRLVHGKGTGALRKTVRDVLSGHPLVESFRDGEASEGGGGATIAALTAR